jgi:branched-chain amino acid transport system substrate-binding protein
MTFPFQLNAMIHVIILFLSIACTLATESVRAEEPVIPVAGQTETPPLDKLNILSQAEIFFHSGKFIDAKLAYEKFLDLEHFGENNRLAYYRLGQIEQESGAYQSALKFYQNLSQKFPNNTYAQEISFRSAQCYFEIGQYQHAEELFRRILLKHPDRQKRWHSLFYLAQLDQRRVDYEGAINKLKQVHLQSDSASIREKANELIETIINQHLTVGFLNSMLETYQSSYPGATILLKLISTYRLQRNTPAYRNALERFLVLFPDHPLKLSIENQLRVVQPTTIVKVKLAAILPLSGNMALTGQKTLQGIQLAMNRLSPELRSEIQLIVKDSKSGQSISEIIQELGNDPDVVAVIGPILSPNLRQAAPDAEALHLPLFSPTASGEGLPELSSFIFRNSLTRDNQGRFIAEHAVNKLGLRRFMILYPNEEYGVRLKEVFEMEARALGAEVLTTIPYERSQNDFKEQILQMGGIGDDRLEKIGKKQLLDGDEPVDFSQPGIFSRPLYEMGNWSSENNIEDLKVDLELAYDAIFIPGFYDKVGLIVPQLVFYNVDNATLLGASGWNSPELIENAGKYLKKGFFVDGFFSESKEPRVEDFVNRFKKVFGQTPSILSAQSYDTTVILLDLLSDKSITRDRIKEGLLKIKNYPGVSGLTSITDQGESDKQLFTLTIKDKKFTEAD